MHSLFSLCVCCASDQRKEESFVPDWIQLQVSLYKFKGKWGHTMVMFFAFILYVLSIFKRIYMMMHVFLTNVKVVFWVSQLLCNLTTKEQGFFWIVSTNHWLFLWPVCLTLAWLRHVHQKKLGSWVVAVSGSWSCFFLPLLLTCCCWIWSWLYTEQLNWLVLLFSV